MLVIVFENIRPDCEAGWRRLFEVRAGVRRHLFAEGARAHLEPGGGRYRGRQCVMMWHTNNEAGFEFQTLGLIAACPPTGTVYGWSASTGSATRRSQNPKITPTSA